MKVRRPDDLVKTPDDLTADREHVLRDLDGLLRRSGAEMAPLFAARTADDASARGVTGGTVRLLDLLDDGLRPTALARAAGVTKQSVSERLRDLEARGLVVTAPDPQDGRAVVVRRTAHGDAVLRAAREAIGALEQSWAQEVGVAQYAAFRDVLARLVAGGRPESPAGGQAGTLDA